MSPGFSSSIENSASSFISTLSGPDFAAYVYIPASIPVMASRIASSESVVGLNVSTKGFAKGALLRAFRISSSIELIPLLPPLLLVILLHLPKIISVYRPFSLPHAPCMNTWLTMRSSLTATEHCSDNAIVCPAVTAPASMR